MSRRVNWAAIALIPVALSLVMRADAAPSSTTTLEFGGTGGIHFDVKCQANDFLIGFEYSSGKALNFIVPVCHAQKNGKWTSAKEYRLLPAIGGPAALSTSGPFFPKSPNLAVPRCAQDQYITAIHIWWDDLNNIHHLEVFCHTHDRKMETKFLTGNQGGEPHHDHDAACLTDYFAIGFIGSASSSTLVNRLGLRCQKID